MYTRLTCLLLLLTHALSGQISEGGRPLSLSLPLPPPKAVALPALDLDAARAEDAAHPEWQRFAAPVSTNISPDASGAWTDVPGGRLWTCVLEAPNGDGLAPVFERLQLPQGARFFAYTPGGKDIWGAFTQKSCTPSGKFIVGPVAGRSIVLELFEPAEAYGKTALLLNRVDVVYDAGPAGSLSYGDALGCHVNVNCSAGTNWQSEKMGIARILMKFDSGLGWCSGTLIANADGTPVPYFLTAHHCQIIGTNPDFDLWRFDFQYEAPGCANPVSEPIRKSVLGCERIAYRHETDFLLLKLEPIPGNYGVYFNGWTRNPNPPANTTHIHHPQGDIKKITVDNQPPTIYPQTVNWGAGFGTSEPNTHWNVLPEVGLFEPGSSGCPLFGADKRIIGQLHGGNRAANDSCKVVLSLFGRFDLSWDQGSTPETRLKDWLDPSNTNASSSNSYAQTASFSVSGQIKFYNGQPLPNVKVYLDGADSTSTNAQGFYQFNSVTSGQDHNLTAAYSGYASNGVTSYDIVLLTKHILGGEILDSPWKVVAGDVNGSNSLTTFDMVDIRRVILGAYVQFPNLPPWRFFPANVNFADTYNPFPSLPPETIILYNLQQNISDANFTGIKVGDANGNAVPGQ